MGNRMRTTLATAVLGLALAGPANAALIGYVPSTTFGGLGGASAFDALFADGGHTLQAIDLSDASQLSSIDGLWLHGGDFSLTATEQTNLTNFLASGRNVVYVTDRSDSGPWSVSTDSVLGPLGGADIVTGGDNLIHATIGSHELVAGVSSLRFNTWSAVDPLVGSPTLLTANGMAAVYSYGLGELLFIGDTNWQRSAFGSDNTDGADNDIFGDNIVTWLTRPVAVPEPTTLSLLVLGLFGMGFAARRRKV